MEKKYIFIDMDGTLINHKDHSIPDSSIEAIRLLKENRHEVFIATGRPPCLFYGIDKELGIESYIAANGRVVVYHGETIYSAPLNKESVKEFTQKMQGFGFDVGYETDEEYYVQSDVSDNVQKFNDVFGLGKPVVKPDSYLNDTVYQLILYIEEKDLDKAIQAYPDFHYSVSNPYGVDVTDKKGLKDIGIKAVVDKLGINAEDCIAVGDGYNDISMIEYVGLGIAMGNAYPKVKTHADYVTDDIDNDGLFKAFKHFKLI